MSTKTKFKDGQSNRYTFFDGGKHTHEWYDSKTGFMGGHGENISAESKKWIGQLTHQHFHSIYEKGDSNMAMRRVRSKGMNLGRHGEIGYTEINAEAGERVAEGDRLHELGVKFESDKTKLEDEIEKVNASSISEKDKRNMIAQLNAAIERLQEQYDRDVAEEEERVQEEIQEQIEQMDEASKELEQQADSLRSVTMDAASTDASAAADATDAKRQEFEQMKAEYTEKLQLQMEQAEIQRRSIRARRAGGR